MILSPNLGGEMLSNGWVSRHSWRGTAVEIAGLMLFYCTLLTLISFDG